MSFFSKSWRIIKVKKDIVLSAGSINSPAILQRSGIGDGEGLKSKGVSVLNHLPGVGKNLQDHLEVYFQVKCLQLKAFDLKINFKMIL